MSGPKLCLVTEEPCENVSSGGPPLCHWGRTSPDRCENCNGDGTRSLVTPAPEGSVLLAREQAEAVRCWLTTTTSGRHLVLLRATGYPVDPDLSAALDALGVERA